MSVHEFTTTPKCPKCAFDRHHRYTCQLPPHDDTIRLECGRCYARWSMFTADSAASVLANQQNKETT